MTAAECTEVLVPGPAQALAGLLGVPVPDPASGLPLLWHTVYLLPRPEQAVLGRDGHPVAGGVPTPPGPGLRRMFAGGRVRTSGALHLDETATRRSAVVRSVDKTGRSGALTFVTVAHEVCQRGEVVVTEEQDIVYRAQPVATVGAAPPRPAGPVPPAAGDRVVDPLPTLLFRYSALTDNAHRIHYDREYAREVEGYAGLVVHGPLQALLMVEQARLTTPLPEGDRVFEYRLLAPLLDSGVFTVRAEQEPEAVVTSVRDAQGVCTAQGRLQVAPRRRRGAGSG